MTPTSPGLVRTVKVQLWPGARIVPSVQLPGLTMKLPFTPNASYPYTVSASLLLFVNVTASSLVVQTGTCPTARTLGSKLRGDVPAEETGTMTSPATRVG